MALEYNAALKDIEDRNLGECRILSGSKEERDVDVEIASTVGINVGNEVKLTIKTEAGERVYLCTVAAKSKRSLHLTGIMEFAYIVKPEALPDIADKVNVSARVKCTAIYIMDENGDEFKSSTAVEFELASITAENVTIYSKVELQERMLIGFNFVEGSRPIEADLLILQKTYVEEYDVYRYRTRFYGLRETDMDVITGYIFQREREMKYEK